MMNNSKIQIFGKIVVSFICFIFIVFISIKFYFLFNHYLPYKYADLGNISWQYIENTQSKEELRQEINKLLNIDGYILKEKHLLEYNNTSGKAFILSKVVYIDPRLDDANFVMTLTHELVHIKYRSSNERFTQYIAWITLYTSDNRYFTNIALWQATLDNRGEVSKKYSITGYIAEYLK